MPESNPKRLYIFDGHSLCYQAYHAIQLLTAPDGTPVNAVYGFLNIVLKVLRNRKPEHVAVVFDSPGPTFRDERYAGYKAQRAPMPLDLRPQIQGSQDAARSLGIPVYATPGFEADDLLATLAAQARNQGVETVLVTNDKDAKQLLGTQVRIYDARKERLYSEEDLKNDTGLCAAQMVDYQCLTGDSIDNVRGVDGVGPKTAQKLLAQFGTLEGVYEHLEEIPQEKLRARLKEAKERAFENRHLLRLRDDVPVELSLSAFQAQGPYPQESLDLFKRFGFQRLLAMATAAGPRANPPRPVATDVQVRIASGKKGIAALAQRLRSAGSFAIETVTRGEETIDARLLGVAFSAQGAGAEKGGADFVPISDGDDPEKTLADLRPVLADARIAKIGRRLQHDRTILNVRAGIPLEGISFDVGIADYLLDPAKRDRSLTALAQDHLGETLPVPLLPPTPELLANETGRSAQIVGRLSKTLRPKLDREGLGDLFRSVEMPIAAILSDMERTGIRIDSEALQTQAREAATDLAGLEKKAHEAAGRPFNVASSQQLAQVLFEELALPKARKTKTGYSTDSDVLEDLADRHPLPAIMLEYRQLAKLKSTYLEALPQKVNPRTGRLHTSFHQTVAATGRLSSSDPNLQNIPIRTPLGRRIRAAFLPSDDSHALLSADYSQIELRILAHLADDPELKKAFASGRDVHVHVATLLYGVAPKDVTDEMRQIAKGVGYSLIYGKTPYTLSRDLKIQMADAARLVEAFFTGFPMIRAFRERAVEEARRTGRVRTLLGRIRNIPEAASKLRNVREAGERAAINTVVQGSAADLIKKAMIDVAETLRAELPQARILLQIHDELLLDIPKAKTDIAQRVVTARMEQAMKLSVPLEIHIGAGQNWLEAAE